MTDDDVKAVARALAKQAGYDPDEQWEEFDRNAAATVDYSSEYEGWQDAVFPKRIRWQQFVNQARAAVAATLEIAARDLRAAVFADSDGVYWPDTQEVADWLAERAKEVRR